MKKLVMAIVVVAALVGCSKEAEMALNESGADQVVFNSSGSFDVGTIDAAGNATITYNLIDLQELTACAVSEDLAAALVIENVSGVGYYLTGIGTSTGSNTTFAIELVESNSTLSWEDNAVIFTCETTSATPCTLDVLTQSSYECDNTSGSCGQTVIGGQNGSGYAACNWPWEIPGKTKK